MADTTKGQGWHGDSEGHRKAGKKGGRTRSQKAKKGRSDLSQQDRQLDRDVYDEAEYVE